MKLLLSSFGLGAQVLFRDYFYRMPAVSMWAFGPVLVPDYPVVFLFESFVIDARTVEILHGKDKKGYYGEMRGLVQALDEAGRLNVVDFETILRPYEPQIIASVEYDIRNLDRWRRPLEESSAKWHQFAALAKEVLYKRGDVLREQTSYTDEERALMSVLDLGYYGRGVASTPERTIGALLENWKQRMPSEQREYVRKIAADYFSYVASNLCLSEVLDVVIHDWADMAPLYRKKLELALRMTRPEEKQVEQVRQLFEVVFPDFRPRSATSIVKALDDPRIEKLRSLVDSAVNGGTAFDTEFANRTLREVLRAERRREAVRRVAGWITFPIQFFPVFGTLIDVAANAGIEAFTKRQARRGKEWFYLVSDISHS
jgi:hypothetical protein